MDRFFVVTGGPGAGKSTLIAALDARGIATSPEAGRAIIRDQVASGGSALPWADRADFSERMLAFDLRAHREASGRAGLVVFDRGVPDVVGYLRLCSLPVPSHIMRTAQSVRYNPIVFIAPAWREIFAQDAERKQDFAEAEATCRVMREVYSKLDYRLVDLPLTSVEARADFIVQRLKP